MQKRIPTLLGVSLMLLAACSGTPTADNALPTLAKLPTTAPTATVVPATATIVASPVPTDVPTEIAPPPETTVSADELNAPNEPTATFLPIPEGSQISIFPTLTVGQETTLQGQMTIMDDTHATLTDSNGSTAIVLIDPFAAQMGANQMVQIHGTVETEGDKLVLRMSEITVLSDSTAEPESTASP